MDDIQAIIKEYKSIVRNSAIRQDPYVYIPTSLLSLNLILGDIKGIRSGTIIQLLAKNKTGKSTLAADIVKNAQQLGYTCAWLDYETQYDTTYTSLLGVDNAALLYAIPDTLEQGAELVEKLVKVGVKVIVFDSIPTAVHSTEMDKDMTDVEKMMGTSGVWNRFLNRICPVLYKHDALLVLINQYRANTSPMSRSDKKPWGTESIQYRSSYVLEMVRIQNQNGQATVRITVTKNRCANTEGHTTDVLLEHGCGFRHDLDLLTLAIKYEVIAQKGAWYTYKDVKAQGFDSLPNKFDLQSIQKELLLLVSNL